MGLTEIRCPTCNSQARRHHMNYTVQSGEERHLYQCTNCGCYYAETKATPLAGLRTPISQIAQVLTAQGEGMGLNAAVRVFRVAKNSIYLWMKRLCDLKETRLLYARCHRFLLLQIEGDELYTRVGQNQPPADSTGWTIILMERASRFIWEMSCDTKTASLFEHAIDTLVRIIAQTEAVTLFTDGERRYGHLLFDICQATIRMGQRGRPKTMLVPGVAIRLKNIGNQAHHPGRKRPKYQAPWAEHPQTAAVIPDHEIHTNHLEAFHSALRRRLACFRRGNPLGANTYAKRTAALQARLALLWLWHNFVSPHFTTKSVPAVALGILSHGFSWSPLFRIPSFQLN